MYTDYFKFNEAPFNITSDPDFFFSSIHHAEAISHLTYGIHERKGIIVITGEIGTGKTTLCKTLLNRLDSSVKTAFVLNPNFSEVQLLKFIVNDFGIKGILKNKFDLVNALNSFLLKESSEGNNVVLIIDEAQNLKVRQLEAVRLLSNLETDKSKLLQIILVGQPELDEKLSMPALRQLNQRVSIRYRILPLNQQEIHSYINHRIEIASSQNELQQVQFTPEAINAIFEHSKGTPRMINILCDRALLAGFNENTTTINEDMIEKCRQEILI